MFVKCGKLQKNVENSVKNVENMWKSASKMWITAPKMWETLWIKCGNVENMWKTCGKLICMYKCAILSATIQT